MKYSVLALLIFVLNALVGGAQSQLPDSIQSKLSLMDKDTAKVTELLSYSRKISRANTSLNESVLNLALQLAIRSNHVRSISRVKVLIGQSLLYKNQFDSARFLYHEALVDYRKLNDSTNIGVALFEIGTVYYYEANDSSALSYYIQASKIFELLGDEKRLGFIYNNISNVYDYLGDTPAAIEYIEKSILLKRKFGLDQALGSSYHNLGVLLSREGDKIGALENFRISVKYKKRFSNLKGLASTFNSLAELYMKLNVTDSALFYHKKAIDVDIALSDSIALVQDRFSLANTYSTLKQHKNAIDLAVWVNANTKSEKTKEKVLKLLAENYEQQKEYELATTYYSSYINLHDSLTNFARTKAVDELKTQYETEKKEIQIAQLERDHQIQDLQAGREKQYRIFLFILVVLLVITAVVIYYNYRIKLKANVILDEQNRAKSKLFTIISHDLKNPVSAFRNMTEGLVANLDNLTKDKINTYLTKMGANATEVESQLNELLIWASQQLKKEEIKTESVEIKPLVEQVLTLVTPLSEQRGVTLSSQVAPDFSLVAHPELLKTVLRNIVTNALKFTESGGTVELVACNENSKPVIIIKDTGIGMRPAELELLLNSSDTSEIKNHDNKGTGLGFSLIKDIMEKLNGQLSVDSEYEKGTTFTLVFSV